MRYLDLRASWLGGSGHILDAQCNARLPSASMAARRAAWLTASALPGWWALTAAAGEGWVLDARRSQLWLAHGQLEDEVLAGCTFSALHVIAHRGDD